MKTYPLLIIVVLLFAVSCSSPTVEEPIVTDPVVDTQPEVPEEISNPPELPDEETVTPPATEETTPVEEIEVETPEVPVIDEINETQENTTETVDPQYDPEDVVDAYFARMTKALDGDDAAYSEAYELISPHSKKNIAWVTSLTRFKSEAKDTYEKYGTGNNLTGYMKSEVFGNGYKVYYSYEGGEVNYIVSMYDGLYYIASGNVRGSMFWRAP